MDGLRFKELQGEFVALRLKWVAAESIPERQAVLARIIEVLDECNGIVERRLQQRLARYRLQSTRNPG